MPDAAVPEPGCICGDPSLPGRHRTDGPCVAPESDAATPDERRRLRQIVFASLLDAERERAEQREQFQRDLALGAEGTLTREKQAASAKIVEAAKALRAERERAERAEHKLHLATRSSSSLTHLIKSLDEAEQARDEALRERDELREISTSLQAESDENFARAEAAEAERDAALKELEDEKHAAFQYRSRANYLEQEEDKAWREAGAAETEQLRLQARLDKAEGALRAIDAATQGQHNWLASQVRQIARSALSTNTEGDG